MKKAILLALWLPLCLNLPAQSLKSSGSVTGIIRYGGDNSNYDGTMLTLKSAIDTLYRQTIVTAKAGHVRFDNLPFETYSISVMHIGFNDTTIRVSVTKETPNFDFGIVTLRSRSTELKEVTIEVGPKAYIQQKIDRTVVSVNALIANTGTNAAEALNNAPGVEVSEEGVSLRGKQGVTVYIDDKQTHLEGRNLISYLRSLPSDMLDKLELMPNPPAMYHSSGGGGVINISTKKVLARGFNGSVSVSQGQGAYSKSDYSATLNYKGEKVNVYIGTGYSAINNFYNVERSRTFPTRNEQQQSFETNNQKSIHYKLGLDYILNKKSAVQFTLDGFASPYKENGSYLLGFQRLSSDSTISTDSYLTKHTSNNSLGLNYQYKFNEHAELGVSVDYLKFNDESAQNLKSNTFLPTGSQIGEYELLSRNPFEAEVYGLKLDYNSVISNGIKLSYGGQVVSSERNSSGIYSADSLNNTAHYKEHISSLYLSILKDLKKFSIQAGLRFDNTQAKTNQFNFRSAEPQTLDYNYSNLFPSLFLQYRLDSSLANVLAMSLNTRVDRPAYSALNPTSFFFDRYTLNQGNSLLTAGRTTNLELSFSHTSNLKTGVFYNYADNSIIYVYNVVGQSLVNTFSNIKTVTTLELYSSLSLRLLKWLNTNLYAELFRKRYAGIILNAQDINNQITAFNISGNNQLKLKNGWSAELGGSYRTKIVSGQGFYLPIWRLNAAVRKSLFNDRATLSLSGKDLFHSWIIKRDISPLNANLHIMNTNDTQQLNLVFTYRVGTAVKTRNVKGGLESERSRAGLN